MDEYNIIVTNHALRAFAEIRDYIAIELVNPSAAVNHAQLFRSEIKKLAENPSRFKLIDEQPWHDEGVRKIRVKNYCIYYWIDEETHTVYVTDALYVGRDQSRWLKEMPKK